MLERVEVEWTRVVARATDVGATVLAFDFAEYADDRVRIVSLRQGAGTCRRPVGHCYRSHPPVEPCGEAIGVEEAEEAANTQDRLIVSPGPCNGL